MNAHRKQVEETMDIVREVCNEHEFGGLSHTAREGCLVGKKNALRLQHRELKYICILKNDVIDYT